MATASIGGDGVITSAITADVFDYQQWKTGKRLEGFITQFSGMLTTGAGMLTSLILPWFYERYGLQNDYDVLFQESVRTPIFGVMIITTVISCVLSNIHRRCNDITESSQHEIIADLEARAQSESAEEK